VPLKTYDESLDFLRSSLDRAKLGDTDKLDGFRRLNAFVQNVESLYQPEAEFTSVLRHERKTSSLLGGRTVMDDKKRRPPKQRSLF
jgi:hypothetical protein